MAYNEERAEKMRKLPTAKLWKIYQSGSLSAAAAHYEIMRRKGQRK